MSVHPLAGRPVPADRVTPLLPLVSGYHVPPGGTVHPVAFGTSGHRGSSLDGTFNEPHVLAICQAIAEHRRAQGITGPLFLGRDTHALSEPAFATALEVFAGNGVSVVVDDFSPYTPTPVVSHAILSHNRERTGAQADGVIITPSHNPPEDGGIKYNPPSGGAAQSATTAAIQARANALMEAGLAGVRRSAVDGAAGKAAGVHRQDIGRAYVTDLAAALDVRAIAAAGVRIGVDPLGGSTIDYWDAIAEAHGLEVEVVNRAVDPSFAFMRLDWDGRVRMDCSSRYAMAGLVEHGHRFDVACGSDPDGDRHGIVTPGAGLMDPNHYLAAAAWYLFQHRPDWPQTAGIGKTLVSSAMIDHVAAHLDRPLVEVPVGFKWFVDDLNDGAIAFAGEESAGATFLRRDGLPWTTDKDGILLSLLAAEITAVVGRDPSEVYAELEGRFGRPAYARTDVAATAAEKAVLAGLSPESVAASTLAGEPIRQRLTEAPGNGAPIGGLKVVTDSGWFAARPSGTENVYKVYAESFQGPEQLRRIQEEAAEVVREALSGAGA